MCFSLVRPLWFSALQFSLFLSGFAVPRGIEASVERSFPEINTTVTLSRPPGAPDIVPLLAINITDDQVGAEEEERAVLEVALGGTEGVRLGAQRQLSVIITDTDCEPGLAPPTGLAPPNAGHAHRAGPALSAQHFVLYYLNCVFSWEVFIVALGYLTNSYVVRIKILGG